MTIRCLLFGWDVRQEAFLCAIYRAWSRIHQPPSWPTSQFSSWYCSTPFGACMCARVLLYCPKRPSSLPARKWMWHRICVQASQPNAQVDYTCRTGAVTQNSVVVVVMCCDDWRRLVSHLNQVTYMFGPQGSLVRSWRRPEAQSGKWDIHGVHETLCYSQVDYATTRRWSNVKMSKPKAWTRALLRLGPKAAHYKTCFSAYRHHHQPRLYVSIVKYCPLRFEARQSWWH